MGSPEIEKEEFETTGVFSEFVYPNDFIMAFSVSNSMNRVGEDYCEALSPICLQSMRFLNTYASKVNVDREDVIALLLEFGLSPKLVPKVIDHVMQLSQEYHSIVDSFVQSLSSYTLVDFSWSLRMIVCDSHISKRQLFVVRLSLQLQDKENRPLSLQLELDQSQLESVLSMFDRIDNALGTLNTNL
ncbi:hypothetical protein WA538_001007 [Blastocystis sp. DL]